MSAKSRVFQSNHYTFVDIINVMMEVDNNDDKEEKYDPNTADDDDPVVSEMPVYLSKSLQCYLFQYPVRPASLEYDTSLVTRARFRPNNKQVQLEVRLNTNSDNYDKSKGEQIALNTDGVSPGPSTSRYFSSRMMDKQVLSGERSGGDARRYALARLVDNQLHLSEVQEVLQLRPSLGYMDKSDKTAKAEGRVKDDPDDPDTEEDKQPQAVTVKFSRVYNSLVESSLSIYKTWSTQGDSDRVQKIKEKSYDYQMKRQEEEAWTDCEYHGASSEYQREVSQRMLCHQDEEQSESKQNKFQQTHKQYLDQLKKAPG